MTSGEGKPKEQGARTTVLKRLVGMYIRYMLIYLSILITYVM
jgi:hypothetical protein